MGNNQGADRSNISFIKEFAEPDSLINLLIEMRMIPVDITCTYCKSKM